MAKQSREQWKNVSKGTALVNVYDPTGNGVQQEVVRAGRTVVLSAEERRLLNQNQTPDAELDIFGNGILLPLTLAEDSEDLQENPNHMTDSDMRDIFSIRNHLSFKAALAEISSVPVLQRLLYLADSDQPSEEDLNPTVKQRENIVARLEQLQDSTVDVVEVSNAGHVNASNHGDQERSQVQRFRHE
jgi:hypothetical protein